MAEIAQHELAGHPALAARVHKAADARSVASASGVSAWLGITEPAIFGVNLKLRFPFYAAPIGGGIGAAYATMVQVLSVSQGPCGIIGVICIRPDCMLQFLVSVVIAIVCTFVITLVFAKTIGRKQLATL